MVALIEVAMLAGSRQVSAELASPEPPTVVTQDLERRARALVFHKVQLELFPEEVKRLLAGQLVLKESKLFQYQPFIDDDGVMRVGGRPAGVKRLDVRR